MGLHDALDGFITFRQAQHAGKTLGNAGVTSLSAAVELLSVLCQYRNWTTDDPLGLGGLAIASEHLMHLVDQLCCASPVFFIVCPPEQLEKVADCKCIGPKVSLLIPRSRR
jgi:hypothetical protein